MTPVTHGRGLLPLLAACLAGSQILCAAPKAPENRLGRRSGPRYTSYLASLPMGTFVEAMSLDQLAEVVVTDTKAAQAGDTVTQKMQNDSSSLGTRRAFGRYRRANLKGQASLSRSDRSAMSLILELNNLTNRKSEMPWQFQDPGFNFQISLQVVF
jgi:hypothetical protein